MFDIAEINQREKDQNKLHHGRIIVRHDLYPEPNTALRTRHLYSANFESPFYHSLTVKNNNNINSFFGLWKPRLEFHISWRQFFYCRRDNIAGL